MSNIHQLSGRAWGEPRSQEPSLGGVNRCVSHTVSALSGHHILIPSSDQFHPCTLEISLTGRLLDLHIFPTISYCSPCRCAPVLHRWLTDFIMLAFARTLSNSRLFSVSNISSERKEALPRLMVMSQARSQGLKWSVRLHKDTLQRETAGRSRLVGNPLPTKIVSSGGKLLTNSLLSHLCELRNSMYSIAGGFSYSHVKHERQRGGWQKFKYSTRTLLQSATMDCTIYFKRIPIIPQRGVSLTGKGKSYSQPSFQWFALCTRE